VQRTRFLAQTDDGQRAGGLIEFDFVTSALGSFFPFNASIGQAMLLTSIENLLFLCNPLAFNG
jgi:hypothetical protein